jgi:hypothetical protein
LDLQRLDHLGKLLQDMSLNASSAMAQMAAAARASGEEFAAAGLQDLLAEAPLVAEALGPLCAGLGHGQRAGSQTDLPTAHGAEETTPEALGSHKGDALASPRHGVLQLEQLPDEVLANMFRFLSFSDALRVGLTSQRMKALVETLHGPYQRLDLQRAWDGCDDALLEELVRVVPVWEQLSLAWCSRELLSPSTVHQLIRLRGHSLTTLRLASCSLVSDELLHLVASHCSSLVDLDLQMAGSLTARGYRAVSQMAQLQRLNLFGGRPSVESLVRPGFGAVVWMSWCPSVLIRPRCGLFGLVRR